MTPEDLFSILEKSHFYFKSLKDHKTFRPVLNGLIAANIFFENSTRTKFSFEVAQKRLGAHVLNFDASSSSLAKGESLLDTLKTFNALGARLAIIRHSDDDFVSGLKDQFGFSVVNAGAGKSEHPSQSLLDLFTIQQEFKKWEGLTIAICGDIASSRVAKSNMRALKKLGVKTLLCGPKELLPQKDELTKGQEIVDLDEAVKHADVLMFLRVQHERHEMFELPTENYNDHYGLNDQRLKKMKKDAIIMHPGPVNRGVEILDHLVECEKSRIFKQVENGVYARMAALDWIMEKSS